MSLKKFRKRVVSKVKDKAKDYGRATISVAARVSRVARPVVSAAASYLYGPLGGAAVTAISHYPHQYQETVKARNDGLRGRDARGEGRDHAQRTTIHSLIAMGVGSAAAGVTGGWQASAVGVHGQALTGWGTGAGALGLTNPFMSVPTAAAATTASSAAAAAAVAAGTQAGAQAVAPKPPAPAANTSSSWLDDLLNQLGLGGSKGGGSDTPGEATPGAPGGAGGGGGIMDALEKAASNDTIKWAAGGALVAAVIIGSRKAA